MNYKKTLLFVTAYLLCLPLSVSYAQNTIPDNTKNQAELTLSDQSKHYYNTDYVKSIDISGTSITVVPNAGQPVTYDKEVTNITFIKAANPARLSPNAQRLLDYLNIIYGSKTLSGTMANVNWNINEARWVYKHTGRWPAVNCFDFLHHVWSSPGGWIDYSNTSVVEDWYNNGGIVADRKSVV